MKPVKRTERRAESLSVGIKIYGSQEEKLSFLYRVINMVVI